MREVFVLLSAATDNSVDPRFRLALEFASDLTKQLITLSAAILALSVTFAKDVLKSPSRKQVFLLSTSWVLYFFSILAGIWELMALTGLAAPSYASLPSVEIGSSARWPSGLQIGLFGLGTICLALVGVISLSALSKQTSNVSD